MLWLWSVLSWLSALYVVVRVASLYSSAFWIHHRGVEFSGAMRRGSTVARNDAEYQWAEIQRLAGGPRLWRPFGIRSLLLDVAAQRADKAGRSVKAVALRAVRFSWRWPFSVAVISALVIIAALVRNWSSPSSDLGFSIVAVVLLSGSLAIVWEARAAMGTMGGWASPYHRYPTRSETRLPAETAREAAWADTRVAVASGLVALMTILQAQIWVTFASATPASEDPNIWQIVVAPFALLLGNVVAGPSDSVVAGVVQLETIVVAIAYLVLTVTPTVRD